MIGLTHKILLLVLAFINFSMGEGVNLTDTEYMGISKLRSKLFTNYDKHSRPIQDNSSMISINFTFSAAYSFKYDERNETFTIEGSFRLKWIDFRWIWNPSEYGGIDSLPVEAEEIWLPDIGIYESVPAQMMTSKLNTRPKVASQGIISWSPRGVFKTLCPYNADNYPQDMQICNMTFGSWSSDALSVDFQVGSSSVYLKSGMYGINNNWKLLDFKVNRVNSYIINNPNPFVSIVVTSRFLRSFPAEIKVATPPVIVATILMLSMFWLPLSLQKKLSLGGTALIMLLGLMLYVAASVRSPLVIGVAVSYIRSVIFITISAMLSEIVVIVISKLKMLPPSRLKNFTDSRIGRILVLNSPNKPIINEDELMVEDKKSLEDTWYKTAMATDRFFFVLFGAICMVNQILQNK